ncbi:MAG TPA: hypothetical protein VF595_18390 [Tepidisphaeraceae bacterium]|jgi:hypothetical protein
MTVLIVLLAIVMHLFALHALKRRTPRAQAPIDVAILGDGASYISVGQQLAGGPEAMRYDRRVFLGFPLVIAGAIRLGMEPQIFSLVFCTVAWAAFLVLMSHLLGDYGYGVVAAVFPPTMVLDTTMVMNEQLTLLLSVAGLILALRGGRVELVVAAALIAYATLVRPVAVFTGAGAAVGVYRAFGMKRSLAFCVALAVSGLAIHGLVTQLYWSIFESSQIYRTEEGAYGSSGSLFTYPYGSFVMAIRNGELAQQAFLFKCGIALAGIVCLALLVRRAWRCPTPLHLALVTWGLCGYAFVICIGSFWGARIHPRGLTWILPCLIAPVVPLIPRRHFGLVAGGLAVLTLSYLYFAPYSS